MLFFNLLSEFVLYNLAVRDFQVAGISQVLRPGGVFVASNYILDNIYAAVPILGILR